MEVATDWASCNVIEVTLLLAQHSENLLRTETGI
jgi:hypothetical protein